MGSPHGCGPKYEKRILAAVQTLVGPGKPVSRQVSEVKTARRSRAAGKLSEATGGAALKRLLYLASRADSKAFGQTASAALLFGIRHAADTETNQACIFLPTITWVPEQTASPLARRAVSSMPQGQPAEVLPFSGCSWATYCFSVRFDMRFG